MSSTATMLSVAQSMKSLAEAAEFWSGVLSQTVQLRASSLPLTSKERRLMLQAVILLSSKYAKLVRSLPPT